jgi:hypothetical protein
VTTPPPPSLAERIEQALRAAGRTHPCSCGSTNWASCYHDGKLGNHEARRAAAVLTVVQPELDAAQATGMQKASAMLRRHCPDHSAGTYGTFMACHCPAADEIDRDADRLLAARTQPAT